MTQNKLSRTSGRTEEITIQFKGPKHFCQELVDAVYKVVIDDDFMEKYARPGCGLTFNSSLPPSEEVMI